MKLPQLSLRDLFWLVALVALGCGWWVEHRLKNEMHEKELNECRDTAMGMIWEHAAVTDALNRAGLQFHRKIVPIGADPVIITPTP